ncbi:MAG: putative DNA binding domain-containing protein, partial [Victivallales bacterium]|nr:putative DNA binding domain-containing protein [Victivallales bacterium]
MTISEVLAMNEKQIFDRKSILIKPVDLSDTLCAFANADGGTVAIGISDKNRRIEGVDNYQGQLNDILRVPIDFCNPTVPVTTEMVDCINSKGKPDHVLLMHIEASPQFHANQADEAFVRVGDKNKKLDFNDRLTLMYAKGVRYYEDEPVADATIDDLDLDFVREYCKRIGYTKSPEEYVRENKKFVTVKDGKEQVSVAAILLFGKNPQLFFPRAYIRFIRYDGTEAKVGKDMNVIKDKIFEGRILEQVEQAVEFIKIQMKEKTYLGHDGIFVTEEEYNEFIRTEIVVNAATHRDYGIKGTDIQIKMFDDRLEVDSPGTFAGMVKKENIRYTHFSRNPKIAAFLKDYGYVKEYGEGVDRMCKELAAIGLPAPVFNNSTFILKTTVTSSSYKQLSIENQKKAEIDEKHSDKAQNVAELEKNRPLKEPKVANLRENSQKIAESEENRPIKESDTTDSSKKLPIKEAKVADSGEKCPIQAQKVTDSGEKLPIKDSKVSDAGEKCPIEDSKVSDSGEKCPIEDSKVSDSGEKLPIKESKVSESSEKLPIKELQINESDKKLPIKEPLVSESDKKLPIKEPLVSESDKKLPIEEPTASKSSEKLPIKEPLVCKSDKKLPI